MVLVLHVSTSAVEIHGPSTSQLPKVVWATSLSDGHILASPTVYSTNPSYSRSAGRSHKNAKDCENEEEVMEEAAVFGTESGRLVALALCNGTVLVDVTVSSDAFVASAAIRVFAKNNASSTRRVVALIGGTDSNIYAVQLLPSSSENQAKMLWKARTGYAIVAGAVVVAREDLVLIASHDFDNNFYAFRVSTGERYWSVNTGGGPSTPAILNDSIAFIGGQYSNSLFAVDIATGTTKWKFTTGNWIDASPLVVASAGPRWEHNSTSKRESSSSDDVTPTALLSSSLVIFGSCDAMVYCVDAGSGTLLWKTAVDSPVHSKAAASLDGRRVFVRTGLGTLVALDASTNGSLLWKFPIGSIGHAAPVTIGVDLVVVDTGTGELTAFLQESGAVKWSVVVGTPIQGSPVLLPQNRMLVAASNGTVLLLQL